MKAVEACAKSDLGSIAAEHGVDLGQDFLPFLRRVRQVRDGAAGSERESCRSPHINAASTKETTEHGTHLDRA